MSIGIIVICLILQRILGVEYFVYQLQWLEAYFHWVVNKVEYVTEGHAAVGLLILLMPPVIVGILCFTLIYHLLGPVVYALVNLVLVWLCIDGRNLTGKDLLVVSYERLFAVIFWFVIFGPGGLILYTAVIALRNYLQLKNHEMLLLYLLRLQAILDWLPVRLLGLSYALVGRFSSVSKLWQTHLQTGLESSSRLVVEYGCAALGVHASALDRLQHETANLINRALVVWLLCIALLTAVFWL